MSISVGDAVWTIRGDISKLSADLNNAKKAVSDTMGEVLNQARSIGIGMTIVGGAIAGALGVAVKAASEQQNAQAQLEAAIKSTGGTAGLTSEELQKMASELQNVTTFGDEVVMSGQALMLTFTQIGKETFPEAMEAALNISTAMKTDLQSSVLQVGKALNDPILGMTALRRVGVSFSEEQKNVIEKLVETGKTLEAQKMILAELNKEFGGSARAAAETFSGALQQVKNQFGDMLEQIGFALIPTLHSLVDALRPVIGWMQNWITLHPQLTGALVISAGALSAFLLTVGPLLIVLPNIVNSIVLLKTGLLELAPLMLPTGMVVLGFAAVAMAAWAVVEAVKAGIAAMEEWRAAREADIEAQRRESELKKFLVENEHEDMNQAIRTRLTMRLEMLRQAGLEELELTRQIGQEKLDQEENIANSIEMTYKRRGEEVPVIERTLANALKQVGEQSGKERVDVAQGTADQLASIAVQSTERQSEAEERRVRLKELFNEEEERLLLKMLESSTQYLTRASAEYQKFANVIDKEIRNVVKVLDASIMAIASELDRMVEAFSSRFAQIKSEFDSLIAFVNDRINQLANTGQDIAAAYESASGTARGEAPVGSGGGASTSASRSVTINVNVAGNAGTNRAEVSELSRSLAKGILRDLRASGVSL